MTAHPVAVAIAVCATLSYNVAFPLVQKVAEVDFRNSARRHAALRDRSFDSNVGFVSAAGPGGRCAVGFLTASAASPSGELRKLVESDVRGFSVTKYHIS